jgi:hypothetical protein
MFMATAEAAAEVVLRCLHKSFQRIACHAAAHVSTEWHRPVGRRSLDTAALRMCTACREHTLDQRQYMDTVPTGEANKNADEAFTSLALVIGRVKGCSTCRCPGV